MISVVCPDIKRIQQRMEQMNHKLPVVVDKAMEKVFLQSTSTARAFYYGTDNPSNLRGLSVLTFKNGQADYSLVATGSGVVFLEFGAGWATDVGAEYAKEMPFPVVPASWSIHDAQEFFKHGSWTYHGVTYDSIYPTRGMFIAGQELKRNIESGEWMRDEVTGL